METILTRCPRCSKLYNVAYRDLNNDSPQFQCVQCQSRFWFSYDDKELKEMGVNAVSIESLLVESFEEKITKSPHKKDCPKCGATNDTNFSECVRCGVIFNKVKKDPKAMTVEELLEESWELVMADFEDLTLHEKFVQECSKKQNLPFASVKYAKILSVNPTDDIAKAMRKKIIDLASPQPMLIAKPVWLKNKNLIWGAAVVVSFLIILMALSDRALKNMAGLGAAILTILIIHRVWSQQR